MDGWVQRWGCTIFEGDSIIVGVKVLYGRKWVCQIITIYRIGTSTTQVMLAKTLPPNKPYYLTTKTSWHNPSGGPWSQLSTLHFQHANVRFLKIWQCYNSIKGYQNTHQSRARYIYMLSIYWTFVIGCRVHIESNTAECNSISGCNICSASKNRQSEQ